LFTLHIFLVQKDLISVPLNVVMRRPWLVHDMALTMPYHAPYFLLCHSMAYALPRRIRHLTVPPVE